MLVKVLTKLAQLVAFTGLLALTVDKAVCPQPVSPLATAPLQTVFIFVAPSLANPL
jgi:hypothetical protein